VNVARVQAWRTRHAGYWRNGLSRKLLTRAGFFNPSLDGGLELFELFNPSRRSSSARRAFSAAISAVCAAISAISSSRLGSLGVARIIRLLIQKPIPPSRKI
jgi:hypothetical protein